jgi:LacI family transcriptional regulator
MTDTSTGRLTIQEAAGLIRYDEGAAVVESESIPSADRLDGIVGFVFTSPSTVEDTHVFLGPLVRAARSHATAYGLDVVFVAPGEDSTERWLEAEAVERCLAYGTRGLVVLGGADGNPDVLSRLGARLPTVFVEYDPVGGRSAYVGIDNETAFAEAVVHLASARRSRIATITGPLDTSVGAERLNAYRAALRRLGYTIRPAYIQTGDYRFASGYDGMQRLLALDEPPDAVAAACDVQAVGAMLALQDAGLRCPEDVAVTGFDDAAFAERVSPGLTTVRQPATKLGVAAVEALITMLRDPGAEPPRVMLSGELVVRESCGTAAEVVA